MHEFSLGLQLMGMGLVGVFSVLIIFYLTIKALMFLFPYKESEQ